VLLVVLLSAPGPVGVALLATQALLFGMGAALGVQHTPAAFLFRTLVRPRLGPPPGLEDAGPPRFAQGVGLAFAVVALVGYLSGLTWLGIAATASALLAAALNATLRFCLGCRLYGICKLDHAPLTRTNIHTDKEEVLV